MGALRVSSRQGRGQGRCSALRRPVNRGSAGPAARRVSVTARPRREATYGETVTNPTSVPAPLGWCSWCLGDHQEEHQAVTIFDGTALCRSCNETANENMNQAAADRDELMADIQRR